MVVDSLKKTLKNPPKMMRSEKTQKCVQFASEMKQMGLIKHNSPASRSPENSLEQLKLLTCIQLPKKKF